MESPFSPSMICTEQPLLSSTDLNADGNPALDVTVRSLSDDVLLDGRVLKTLLDSEERYLPAPYFRFQSDLKPYMRHMVSSWMFEVCEEQHCEAEVFNLAMNYLDRFLSIVSINRNQLQLLGTSCMFIASKLKETIPLSSEKLINYTDNSITMQELLDMELLVLSRLKWDVSAVTPHDFLDQILARIDLDTDTALTVRKHSSTFIAFCATDCKFAMCPASTLAASSVASACNGLLGRQWVEEIHLFHQLHLITRTETDYLQSCQQQIEELLHHHHSGNGSELQSDTQASTIPLVAPETPENPLRTDRKCESGPMDTQPTTPTDVREITC